MCTAISIKRDGHFFGRTLDVEKKYGESVITVPRNYEISFLFEKSAAHHPAIVGIGLCVENYPLLFDAQNEMGLAGAALNFPGNAVYNRAEKGKRNIASFELLPYVLSFCSSVNDVRSLLKSANIVSNPFSRDMPASPLHWMFSDKDGSVVVESTAAGLFIYDDPYGVMTNNPPFPEAVSSLSYFMSLTSSQPENTLCADIDIIPTSSGLGAIGLPGDFSSYSRFVRALFVKSHILEKEGCDSVSSFFHIADSVKIPYGCVLTEKNEPRYTVYTSCMDTENFIYSYTTYEDRCIKSISPRETVDMDSADIYTLEL